MGTNSNTDDLFDQHVARLEAEGEIKCPSCGYVYDFEKRVERTTTWGDGEPMDDECPNCEAELVIEEHVCRTFDVKLKKEADAKGGA